MQTTTLNSTRSQWILEADDISAKFSSRSALKYLTVCRHPELKLSLQEHPLSLVLATDAPKIQIPRWRFHYGSSEPVAPEHEEGYQQGFHLPDHGCDQWADVKMLTQLPAGAPFHHINLYLGYAWYRQPVTLPESWSGQPIHFVLGGMDQFDWQEITVYLNGQRIGGRLQHGRWHEPGQYILTSSDPFYRLLQFGGSNVLALQCRGLDKRSPNMQALDLERYSGFSPLFDQYISAGPAEKLVDHFLYDSHQIREEKSGRLLDTFWRHPDYSIRLQASYRVPYDEAAVYKSVTVENTSDDPLTLLRLNVQTITPTDVMLSGGGSGEPVFIGEHWFAGLRHPAGVAAVEEQTISLHSLPGCQLTSGQSYQSPEAVIAAGDPARPGYAFVDHLSRYNRRQPGFDHLYSPYGLCDIASSLYDRIEFTESMLHETLDLLQRWQQQGIRFDYYCIDTGWCDPLGDLKQLDPTHFPSGTKPALRRIRELDMKPMLWVSPSHGPAAFRDEVNPKFTGCGCDAPDDQPYCPAHKTVLQMLSDAMRYMIKEHGVAGFKLDGISLLCFNECHDHLPAKYSAESICDAMIGLFDDLRQQDPDVLLMLYWGFTSPWWMLYADTIYERGITMEGATPSARPAPHPRQSISVALDQGHEYNWFRLPPTCQDSLGVWLSDTRWGSWLGKEQWQDAFVLDFIRGNRMSQLWGDLSLLDVDDQHFLNRIQCWLRKHAELLHDPRRIVGSSWQTGSYGYLYGNNEEAVVVIHNAQLNPQKITLDLSGDLGLMSTDVWDAEVLYPAHRQGLLPLSPQEQVLNIHLGPFEVMMIHVTRSSNNKERSSWCSPGTVERLALHWQQDRVTTLDSDTDQRAIQNVIFGREMPLKTKGSLDNAAALMDPRDRKILRTANQAHVTIPPLADHASLFVTIQLRRGEVAWHHHALFDIVRLVLEAKGIESSPHVTPNRYHDEAGGWSWITYAWQFSPGLARTVQLTLETTMPADLTCHIEAWLFDATVAKKVL